MTYLFPRHMRMGSPVITAVLRDEHGFWLVTFHDLGYDHRLGQMIPPDVNGMAEAYGSKNSVRISEELYQAFLVEAQANIEQYPQETAEQKEERERNLGLMVAEYKREHGIV